MESFPLFACGEVELAYTRHTRTRVELLHIGPLGDRAWVECKRPCGLCNSELLATQVVADLAEGFIVEHGAAPSDRVVGQVSPVPRLGCAPVSVPAQWAHVMAFAAPFQAVPTPGRAVLDRR